ncbi:substrate-binding periplasmic protein [Azospirillum rugosum]|uniref:Solute-binding protein family 3/N-terminal domain-containing protein n=1 Tax=Azospirillum rugosum TaxID=416170 RepID=A0ABS4SXL9_9PROT|nr:transporter substrate-binding domain-containing protein [Azospirillum rugosum]MBP2297294.1 polar amino acid transport system substrate-binding protein/arginine transport system substrate-binding protein/lysine/arginine/ornithine transport system substrate-binding protein/histidine transport system substrate-binding protein [Azospirillum rugosum]MDQ0531137.1 polar amino acid transport system substrate-binding protein/arginine transport system substrate-binding protein/lysine/arginine/ornithine 
MVQRALTVLWCLAWLTALPLAMARAEPPAPAPAEPRTLRVVVSDNAPPFSRREADGTLVGFNVDFGNALCRVLQVTCSMETAPFNQLIDEVAAGHYDLGIGNVLRTPEREKRLLFSTPYWRSSSSLLGQRGFPELTLADAARGRRIAVVRGSQQYDVLARMSGPGTTLLVVPTLEDLWVALLDGRAELVLAPTLKAVHFLLSDAGQRFETIGTPMTDNGLGGPVHMVLPLSHPDLKAAVDRAIAAVRSDGTYQSINRQYFPFDIY